MTTNRLPKLTERDARAIRLLAKHKIYTASELAALFNVSRNLIHKIVAGTAWAGAK